MTSPMPPDMPWQLKMFQKTLKKQMRLKHLKRHIGELSGSTSCLLVSCGDNNGAINYHLRSLGGSWEWADLEDESIEEMSGLLGEPVRHVRPDGLPFPDGHFDCVVSIDVHEHLEDPHPFTGELYRVTRPAGRVVVTVPNGDPSKVASKIKKAVGMTREAYGHYRDGFDMPELRELLRASGYAPAAESSFSGFFTEMLELAINFAYVKLLSGGKSGGEGTTPIAPNTEERLRSVAKTYRIYSVIYPIFRLFSGLDVLTFAATGHVVMMTGVKPEERS